MRQEHVASDVTVIGGGLAGICAAIAAARRGKTVSLVQNRPVLGGNSSSEMRVWVGGANGLTYNRFARENGIMGELFLENQYRNPEGNPYLWDLVLLEAVKAEPNIRLFLNTDVREVALAEPSGPEERRIASCTGWMMGSERLLTFESPLFVDCSGDSLVAVLAGAAFRTGREARSETGEPWAPEEADDLNLGSTILFYTKDTGAPVRFVPPSFARDIARTSIPLNRIIRTGEDGAAYWWIEYGGTLDTIHDDAAIRDELWAAVYGIWDYIKNSGRFEAETLTLEWVGALPGKRESRRLEGDYIFTQHDVMAQTPFEDRIGFGGWMVDLHPAEGMYAKTGAALNMYAEGVFHLPFRSLYSRNVSNLLFAGRNFSATRAGMGATRVMATCAVMGEAAGAAAALCHEKGIAPRSLARDHIRELQYDLLREDGAILGLSNQDPANLATRAKVSASSRVERIAMEAAGETVALESDIGILLPVDPELGGIELLLDAASATEVTVELWSTRRPENYVPFERLGADTRAIPEGAGQWVGFSLPWRPEAPCNGIVVVKANGAVSVQLTDAPLPGFLTYRRDPEPKPFQYNLKGEESPPPPVLEWSIKPLAGKLACLRLEPETAAYAPERAVNGFARPYGGPNLWSAPAEDGPQWMELAWEGGQEIRAVHLTFNDDVHEHFNNLHRYRTPYLVVPRLVKDFRVELVSGEDVVFSEDVTGNRVRHRVFRLDTPVRADRLKILFSATNGAGTYDLQDVRVY